MDISVPTALKSLAMTGAASKAIAAWRKKSTGDSRAIVDEVENNLRYIDLVVEDGIEISVIIKEFSTKEFDRLRREGFNFNSLNHRKISRMPSLESTDLESWQGKETQELVNAIYSKLKDIIVKYPHTSDNPKYRWGVRVVNVRKRIWLLIKHLQSKI